MNPRYGFRLLLGLCIAASVAPSAQAASYTAASCNYSDVNAVINGPTHIATDGDTINIPPGSCTWTNGISVPAGIGISIIGSGTPNTLPSQFGAGASSTILIDNATGGGNLFYFNPTYGHSLSRVSMITISPASGLSANSLGAPIGFQGTCTASGCANIRVDNLTFPYNPTWDGLTQPSGTMIVTDNVFGVLDHNSLYDNGSNGSYEFVNFNYSSWLGAGQYGDNSWASADTFGTNQLLYIENNYLEVLGNGLTLSETEGGFGPTAEGGGRVACRFNHTVGSRTVCSNHGTESNGRPRGGRQMEVYGNTMTCPSSAYAGCWNNGILQAAGIRSGTLLMFGNSIDHGFNQFGSVVEYRALQNISNPWEGCDGTGPYDDNDPTTYFVGTIASVSGSNPYVITVSGNPGWTTNQWVSNGSPYSVHDTTMNNGSEITGNGSNTLNVSAWTSISYAAGDSIAIRRAYVCIDEPSRGGNAATLLSGGVPGPTGWENEPSDPVYEAADTSTNTPSFGPFTSGSARIIPNRDYYAEVSQSAQSSPTSPFNGTVGTGYGAGANRPATCTPGVGYWATDRGDWNQSGSGAQGELFVCTSANTWTLHYEPYVYPHPLVSGATPPPAISAFTASPASIASGESATLSWTVSGETSLSISPGAGNVTDTSSTIVSPGATTIYTLTATNNGGSAIQNITVTVTNGSPGGGNTTSSFTPRVYPNPWRSDKHAGKNITFDGLTTGTMIKVFTTSGHKVAELHTDGPSVQWTLTNDSGDIVASGIYIYLIIDSQGDKMKGKVAIIK